MTQKILVTGLGDIGEHFIQFLSRYPDIGKIVACDLNPKRADVVSNAWSGAVHQGYHPEIEFKQIDLFNVEKTTDLLKEVEPTAIFQCASVQSWWEIFTLNKDVTLKLLPSIVGGWLMMHIAPTYSLMKAVKAAGFYGKIPVEIATLPDLTAPALAKVGLMPTCGGGNAQLRIPRMKQIVSNELKVPVTAVEIWQVGEHGGIGTPDDPVPWWIKIEVNGEDVTEKIGGAEGMRRRMARPYWDREPFPGVPHQQSTSACFLANFIDILYDRKHFVGTCCGVQGLVGGYPARLGRKVELALPKEISLNEAIKINEDAARKSDALETIKKDGTIVPTEACYRIMKEVFGFDHREWTLEESVPLALELNKKFKELQAQERAVK